jgi:3-hydroxybutyryl-CoA dehydrogenase
MQERLAIAGSVTIACGLAAVGAAHGNVLLWARSDDSAERAERSVAKHCSKLEHLNGCAGRVRISTDLAALADATFLVEAVVEDPAHKEPLLAELASVTGPDEIIAATTSSLSVAELAQASTRTPARVSGGWGLTQRLAQGAGALGRGPGHPGFVVNRLLFPYLFSAVELLRSTGMQPADVDQCMTLGAGMPMGPIALLDFVGLDVSQAIGETIGATVPERLRELVDAGALGRKSGRGFYVYE